MRFIDEKGRLFGRVSVLDILIALAVIGLGVGFVYQRTSREIMQIVDSNTPFYVTFRCDRLRGFSLDAVAEGDIFYKRYERRAMGAVTNVRVEQFKDIMTKADGTAVLVPFEDRYTVYITLACEGSVTDTGYYINGNMQVSEGNEFPIHSNRLLLNAQVDTIKEP